MQYVRSISGSVSTAWNSINPATLSGAIDVIVVEQDDGSLACSPFHIRFGKWRLLRPYEKKVEFRVNGVRQELPMKLGEGGEAFFVFATSASVPEGLQTSPLVSPAASPQLRPDGLPEAPMLQEPDLLELEDSRRVGKSPGELALESTPPMERAHSEAGDRRGLAPLEHSESAPNKRPRSGDFAGYRQQLIPKLERTATDSALPTAKQLLSGPLAGSAPAAGQAQLHPPPSPARAQTDRSSSPPPTNNDEARTRAMNLSKKLWTSNISNQVTESGDLMLDMTGYKSSDGEALHAEVIARQLLSEEIDGPYDIGALIGADEKGNIWIYSSEEAKEAASRRAMESLGTYNPTGFHSTDALSDPGYHSDDAQSDSNIDISSSHTRRDSDSAVGMLSQPSSPGQVAAAGNPNKNYAKTLRLTSDQLKQMDLRPGANPMSFTVNRATCAATLWYWRHDVPIVISDIDGTITKSDVLGQVLNTLGRDWTHQGVAKLYTDIASNGYNFLYLTSRSVGQADTTRNYLDGVVQEGYRLPKGPVVLSPDRTIAALRREVYLRKPEIFKMACLRDILALFSGHGGATNTTESADAGLHTVIPSPGGVFGTGRGKGGSPFYAGFGNRLTDALSYRSVNIPSTRIFTINSNSEISLDLLSLNKYKTAYGSMREMVAHYFPPVGLLVRGGGEDFTDFNYWRARPLEVVDFTDSSDDDEEEEEDDVGEVGERLRRLDTLGTAKESLLSEDEAGDGAETMDSSLYEDPRGSLDESLVASSLDGEEEEGLTSSMFLEEGEEGEDADADADADDELDGEDGATSGERDAGPVTPDAQERDGQQILDERERTPRKSRDVQDPRPLRGLGVSVGGRDDDVD